MNTGQSMAEGVSIRYEWTNRSKVVKRLAPGMAYKCLGLLLTFKTVQNGPGWSRNAPRLFLDRPNKCDKNVKKSANVMQINIFA